MADKEEKEFQAMLKRLGVEMPAKSKKKTTKPKRKGGTPAKPKYRDGGRFNTIEKELKKYGGDPVNYEILTAPKEIKDRVSRELLSTYEDIKPIFKQRKKALEEMGVTGKQFDTPRKFSPRNPIGARRAERAYGEELKDLVNKTTQGLSKGGSVKKNKSLYTRKGPCK